MQIQTNIQQLITFLMQATSVHLHLYNYTKVVYINARKKVIIGCNIHGDFVQSPSFHVRGGGCPKCANNGHSKMAIDWLEVIMRVQSIFIQHAGNIGEYVISGTKYKVDGYHKDTNTVYEFYGDYFHGNPKRYIANTYNKLLSKTMEELHQATISRE